jgi:hypothetical protein
MAFRIDRGVIKFYDSTSQTYKGRYAFNNSGKLVEINDSGNRVADVSDTTPLLITKNASNIFDVDLQDATNFKFEAAGTWTFSIRVPSTSVGQTGTITIENTATTTPGALPSNVKTPNGDAIDWQTDSGDIAILTYFAVDTSTVLVNYIGNFG